MNLNLRSLLPQLDRFTGAQTIIWNDIDKETYSQKDVEYIAGLRVPWLIDLLVFYLTGPLWQSMSAGQRHVRYQGRLIYDNDLLLPIDLSSARSSASVAQDYLFLVEFRRERQCAFVWVDLGHFGEAAEMRTETYGTVEIFNPFPQERAHDMRLQSLVPQLIGNFTPAAQYRIKHYDVNYPYWFRTNLYVLYVIFLRLRHTFASVQGKIENGMRTPKAKSRFESKAFQTFVHCVHGVRRCLGRVSQDPALDAACHAQKTPCLSQFMRERMNPNPTARGSLSLHKPNEMLYFLETFVVRCSVPKEEREWLEAVDIPDTSQQVSTTWPKEVREDPKWQRFVPDSSARDPHFFFGK